MKLKSRLGDRFMESLVYAAGGALIFIVLAIFFYLAHESKYAFDRKFDYGYRVAMQPAEGDHETDLSLDPNSSLLTANREGSDGLDEKEEGIEAPTLEAMKGTAQTATAVSESALNGEEKGATLYRDNWQAQKSADQKAGFTFYGFASPEYVEKEVALAWEPDAGFDPNLAPYDLRLRLVSAPEGVTAPSIDIDLKKQPKGRILIPAYIAANDEMRTKGYAFEMVALPKMSNAAATTQGFFRTNWDPTLSYAKYGFIPLLIGTMAIAVIGVLVAAPIAIPCAVYLGELAPRRLREWMKPVVELLASVPTVVLGYFGLMLVAPYLQKTLAAAFGLDSGRALLTTGLMMGVLLLPTIASLAEDALRAVPQNLREGGEALGLTPRERLRKIILPAAKSGLSVSILLGLARAIGETMIVWILSGGTATMPTFSSPNDAAANLMRPTRGIPDTVAIEMGNVSFEGVHYGHLFLLGLTLFVFTMILNLIGFRIVRRSAWRA